MITPSSILLCFSLLKVTGALALRSPSIAATQSISVKAVPNAELVVSGSSNRREVFSLAIIPTGIITFFPTQSQAIGFPSLSMPAVSIPDVSIPKVSLPAPPVPEFMKGEKQQAADAVGKYRKPLTDLRKLLANGSLKAQTLDDTGVTFRYIEAYFSLTQTPSLPAEMAQWAPKLGEGRASDLPSEMRGYVAALAQGARAADLEAQKKAARAMSETLEEFLTLTESEVPEPAPSNAGKFLGIIGAQ